MICNYTICCWSTTSYNNRIVDHNSVNPLKTSPEYTRAGVYGKCVLYTKSNRSQQVKGCLGVIDCIVLNAKYWCPNSIILCDLDKRNMVPIIWSSLCTKDKCFFFPERKPPGKILALYLIYKPMYHCAWATLISSLWRKCVIPQSNHSWLYGWIYFTWPLRKQAAYKQATRGPMAVSSFWGTRQWG